MNKTIEIHAWMNMIFLGHVVNPYNWTGSVFFGSFVKKIVEKDLSPLFFFCDCVCDKHPLYRYMSRKSSKKQEQTS